MRSLRTKALSAYSWDNNKNKTSETVTGTMSGYGFDVGTSGYDDEDRLVNWQRDDSNLDQSWNLSLVGDWNSITENASTQSSTHGPAHEILTAATQSITHDVKGNITSIPAVLRPGSDSLALSWDFDNRLTGADVDNDSSDDVTYQYDALGRRVQRDDGTTATLFVQTGQQTFADYTSGTAATSPTYTYVYASYIDEPVYRGGSGGARYFQRNQQYSITALTDASGTIKERYAYSAYGVPVFFDGSGTIRTSTAEGNRYTYTGREWDDVAEFYHYRARIYLPRLGRFGSRDPIGYMGSPWLLYEYVDSQPVCRLDPFGWISVAVQGPRTANDAPWTPAEIKEDKWGSTIMGIEISCSCTDPAGDVTCTVKHNALILIDEGKLRWQAMRNVVSQGLPLTAENVRREFESLRAGVYGHEQIHYRNHGRKANEIAQRIRNMPGSNCMPCNDYAQSIVDDMSDIYGVWYVGEYDHLNPDSPPRDQPVVPPHPVPSPFDPDVDIAPYYPPRKI